MKNDKRLWYFLMVLGCLALLNALISTIFRPFNYAHHFQVINVHWINTIILIAAIAPLIFPQQTLKSETAIVVTNVISLCICASCALADISNVLLVIARRGGGNTTVFSTENGEEEDDIQLYYSDDFNSFLRLRAAELREHLFTYNCIDLAICTLAACISYQMIENRVRISPIMHMVDSRKVQALGLGLVMLSSTAILNHVWERIVMMNHKLAIFVDMHTMDEFSWLTISMATGIFTIMSSRGNQIIQSSAFVLSGATIYPSFFYAWLDYRAMTSTHSRFLFNQAALSSMIALPHIGVLLATFLLFTISMRETVQVRLETRHKIIFAAFSLFFLIVAVALVDISFYAIFTKQFYRIFHSSEQKLPFLAAFLSLFTGLSVFTKFNFITISASIVIALLALNSTYLHIFSYFYLRWNGYFIDVTNLEFLVLPADKFENGTETSMVHTVETSINVLSLFASFSLVTFLMILCRTHTSPSEILEQTTSKLPRERRILILGVSMLAGAFVVLILAIYLLIVTDRVHPLVTIYSQIFQLVLGLSITSFALFQVLVSETLSKYPLYQSSLMFLSIVRALDILTQIDYKDVGTQPYAWTIHALIEYISIFAHFLTIAELLYIQGAGRPLVEPAEIPLTFENPLSPENNGVGDENGYVMLQTNDVNVEE
ncbi:unnamed protein product [Caenorhabditis angaria]|uniref:Uncharacterized protein n=1 Tax=Caenorhabditis angaria TaxID=860376 RepID=A0A9P1MYG3_9PELO|nr:unnamed protein product [Caenorhabditis angaria]